MLAVDKYIGRLKAMPQDCFPGVRWRDRYLLFSHRTLDDLGIVFYSEGGDINLSEWKLTALDCHHNWESVWEE